MQVKINETQDKLYVTVTVAPAYANEKPRGVSTEEVIEWLEENKYAKKYPKLLQKGVAFSGANVANRTGTWIFGAKVPTKVSKSTPRKPAQKTPPTDLKPQTKR